MANLADLAKSMNSKVATANKASSARAVKLAKAILQELLFVTPVDTSNAMSNWQIGVGQRPADTRFPYFFGSRGSTAGQSASAAYAVGEAQLENKKPGQTIFVSNIVDYIGELNRGSSPQAAAGFIEDAVRRAAAKVRGGA